MEFWARRCTGVEDGIRRAFLHFYTVDIKIGAYGKTSSVIPRVSYSFDLNHGIGAEAEPRFTRIENIKVVCRGIEKLSLYSIVESFI